MSEPVAYINVEKRELEWAKLTRWETPTTVKMDKVPLYTAPPTGAKLFTQTEFDEALTMAKAEIMAVAIETTKTAIMIEREACATLADNCINIEKLGEVIRNRIPSQRN